MSVEAGKSRPVLVTGGAGYIGSRIIDGLRESGRAHVAVDVVAPSLEQPCLILDLLDRGSVDHLLRDLKPGAVVHCATFSHLAYQHDLLGSFRTDMAVLDNLLTALRSVPDCRMVCFSSSYVASGLPLDLIVREEQPLSPVANFGVAKLLFEQLVRRVHRDSVVFRLCSVFGKGPARHPNAIVQLIREAQRNGRVTIWGRGARRMQYVSIEDVVRFVLISLDGMPAGIYHHGGDDFLPVREAAEDVARALGAEVAFEPERQEGETLPFLNNGAVKTASGLAFTPFREALATYVQQVVSGDRQ
jgi:UDP-glucose 4-epimerase